MSDEKELDNLSLPDPFLEQTSPSVLEFEESEGDLEQTLDEILGDEEINIEAVELTEREKAELQTTPAQSVDELFADDEELEIEFEDQGELESEISNILSTIQTSDNSAQIKKLKLLLADSFGLELSAPLQPGELEKDIEEILTSAPPSADIPLSESEEELQELEALLSDDSFLQECDSEYVELDSLIESNAEENNDSLDNEPTELLGENEPQASTSELTNNVNALESLDNELDMLLEKSELSEDLQPEQALESLNSELTALLGEEDSLSSLDGELSALLEEQPEELTTLQQNNHEQLASTPELESLDNQLNSLLEESELPEDLQPEQALESLDSELTALLGEEEPLSSLDGELSALLQEQPEELTTLQQNGAEQLASTPELESLGSELNSLLEESELPEDLQPDQALESLDSELTALLGEEEPLSTLDGELSALLEEQPEELSAVQQNDAEQLASTPELESLGSELNLLLEESELPEDLQPEQALESLDSELTALLGEQVEPFDSVDEELSTPVEEHAEDFVTEVHKPEQGLKSLDNELTSLIDSSPLTEKLEPETADESELDKIVLDGALDKLLEEEPPEIDKLFDTSLSEITNDPDVDIFEVASVEMVEPSPRLDLLFSSLEDEISGRAVDRIEALGHIPSSDKQRLDERAANEALDTFDKDLQTLKAAKAEEEQALQDPVVRKKALREITASLKKAAAWRRIFSGLLDSIISIAAGVGIVAVTQGLEVSPLYLIPKALSYSVIFWLFSSTVMLKSAGQSIGQAFFGITTVTKLGNPLNFTSAATRSCTSLFTFMLVFIPASSIILGLPSFSDIISKTRVTTKEKFD